VDDLVDLGRTIDPEQDVWTTRSNRMVFSWIDGQKSARKSTWNQGVRNGYDWELDDTDSNHDYIKDCATCYRGGEHYRTEWIE
jgi:hypothetical protein